jgi:endonuclease-3
MRRKTAAAGSAGRSADELPPLIAVLSRHYSFQAPLSDPLSLILWENIGYLIDDARREALFDEFGARIGVHAEKIARAPDALLLDIAKRGGMRPETRVERWRRIAEIVLDACGGDLSAALRGVAAAKARTLLKRFPSIGDPGADRILLFSGIDVRPSVDSNGLRTLVRLGFVVPGASYAAAYRAAIACLDRAGPHKVDWLISAHMLLREHGRNLCKRAAPLCMACPLDHVCAHAPAIGL